MCRPMKAIRVESGWGLENLKLSEVPDAPKPGPGQLRLRMKAASLNYRDLLTVLGAYNPKQGLPLVPCSDGLGVVESVGDGVSGFEQGDRVCPIFAQAWQDGTPTRDQLRSTLGGPRDGVLSELMTLPAASVVRAPSHLSDEQAATLPCAAVTAWSALTTANTRPGDTVLVQGTGGVSIFALQLAKLMGATVIATSSSDDKLERVRELGADHTINYRSDERWGKTAAKLAGGDGVDHVLDVGGGKTIGQSVRALRPGGTVSVIGVLSGVATDMMLTPVLMQNIRLQGIIVGHRAAFEAMNRAIAAAGLEPVISDRFELSQTRQALEHMQQGGHFGKICLRIAPD